MNCIVIDDEKLVRELLEDNIRQIPYLNLVGKFNTAVAAMELIADTDIDLIFLDIQMPKLNGLQFLRTLSKKPLVIIVSAYEQYALDGYNYEIVDYLLKPFTFERFLTACNRANDLFNLKERAGVLSHKKEEFYVNVEYALVKIAIADIIYVEGLKDYIKIYLSAAAKPVITKMTIKSIEEKVSGFKFIRTHKSFLVAYEKVTAIKRDFLYINDKEIPVSLFYKESVLRALDIGGNNPK